MAFSRLTGCRRVLISLNTRIEFATMQRLCVLAQCDVIPSKLHIYPACWPIVNTYVPVPVPTHRQPATVHLA